MNPEPRVQKALAHAGLGSRRALEEKIRAGRIRMAGRVVQLGDRIIPGATLEIDGKALRPLPRLSTRVLALHKPEGVLCSRQSTGAHPTVFEALPPLSAGRWVHIGRLDLNSSGLLLFTTDGGLAHRMMHPGYGMIREYAVRIHGQPTRDKIARLLQGVRLDDGPARFASLEGMGKGGSTNHWYRVSLHEGRSRLVRRLWLSQGLMVSRLIRIRYGPYQLPEHCRTGMWVELSPAEVGRLYQAVDL